MNDHKKSARFNFWLPLFWLYVLAPLAWGIWSTLQKAMALFN